MRIAVIDLGTNTFNLLVAEAEQPDAASFADTFQTLYNERVPVKLGEGGINQGIITEAAFQRGMDAMRYYAELISKWKGDRILAFATSAVRNATNGDDFVQAVKEATGIEVKVIDGDKEAELIAEGVKQAVKLSRDRSVIIDIGGGSTEFIILDENEIFWKQSFEIGGARLLERFDPSDPIRPEEIRAISSYLDETLQPLWAAVKEYRVRELIGASGSFESLAAMVNAHFDSIPNLDERTECEFIMQQCAFVHADILSSTREQRLQMKGLIPMRVDMIVVSAILVETVISQTGIGRMRYSAYALKEGVLKEFLDGKL
jgi:exopolyphosphatase / guanosine-5'-triphosphate,3'-diphosphate pyrophosphatase